MTRRPAITQGLRALADFLDENPALLAARYAPAQGAEVLFIAASPEAVVGLASQVGSTVETRNDSTGLTHTSTEVGFGTATQDWGTSAYKNGVTLRVVHIEDES